MPQLTRIEVQKHHPRRRSLFVDDAFFCGLDEEVVVQFKLREGQSIEPETLKRLLERAEEVRAREGCLAWLAHAPRSRRELSDRLREQGVEPEIATRVLDRLEQTGLVNDAELARQLLEQHWSGRGWGRRRLQSALAHKGVPREVAERALAEAGPRDEDADCLAVARRKLGLYARLPGETGRRRLAALLARQGFPSGSVWKAVHQVLPKGSTPSGSEASENESEIEP